MGLTFQVVSQLFRAIDETAYEKYRKVWASVGERGFTRAITSSQWQVFCTIALVHNLAVVPHVDTGDVHDG